ncbi:hypothetical protein A2U01_0057395, partial [Trifolium medium]|nr:hypothetical protein [Trifolium medium]
MRPSSSSHRAASINGVGTDMSASLSSHGAANHGANGRG